MGDTFEFADRHLWDADYDGIPEAEASWSPYGGWTERRIKQFAGTSTLAGQGGVDLNVLSLKEVAEMSPAPAVDQAWQDKKQRVVAIAGELLEVSEQLLAEANRPSGPRKTVVRKLASPEVRARAEQILA
jgi:hypothetical protein